MERALTLATLALIVLMMMLGAIVHGTGSSLACPDWPLCYGDAFPPMQGGILYEHSHRLLGSLIGLAAISLVLVVLKKRKDVVPKALLGTALALIIAHAVLAGAGVSRSIWPLAIAGFLLDIPLLVVLVRLGRSEVSVACVLGLLQLIIIQGILGGLTVVLRLPYVVSAGHLGLSMIILALTAVLAVRFSGELGPKVAIARNWLGGVIAGLYVQILLGAFIKHTGASLACGIDVIACNGGAPHGGPAHLHFTHRVLGVLLLAAIIALTLPILKAAKRAGNKPAKLLVIASHALVTLQVILGVGTVQTYISVPLATLHLGCGALLLAVLVALFTVLGKAQAESSSPSPQRELAHAT
ncbi:MAG: heme A synthase [Myxococcota bacterium]